MTKHLSHVPQPPVNGAIGTMAIADIIAKDHGRPLAHWLDRTAAYCVCPRVGFHP